MSKKKSLRTKKAELNEAFDLQLGLLKSQVRDLIFNLQVGKECALSGEHMHENASYYDDKLEDIINRATKTRAAWIALTELAEVRDGTR